MKRRLEKLNSYFTDRNSALVVIHADHYSTNDGGWIYSPDVIDAFCRAGFTVDIVRMIRSGSDVESYAVVRSPASFSSSLLNTALNVASASALGSFVFISKADAYIVRAENGYRVAYAGRHSGLNGKLVRGIDTYPSLRMRKKTYTPNFYATGECFA